MSINRQIEYLNNDKEIIRPFGPTIYKGVISDEMYDTLCEWHSAESYDEQLDYKNYLFTEFGERTDQMTQSFSFEKSIENTPHVKDELLEHFCHYYGMFTDSDFPLEMNLQFKECFTLKNFWLNSQVGTQWQPRHNHGGDLSFIIYLKVPSDEGITTFEYGEKLPGSTDVFRNVPEEKEIVVFPAWLKHQAFPLNPESEPRVTYAGNAIIDTGNNDFTLLKNLK